MRIKEHAGFVDSIEVRVFGPDGKLKRYHKLHNGRVHRFLVWIGLAHNTMTNVGFAECANLIGNVSSPTAFTDVGIGTGTNASAAQEASTLIDNMLAYYEDDLPLSPIPSAITDIANDFAASIFKRRMMPDEVKVKGPFEQGSDANIMDSQGWYALASKKLQVFIKSTYIQPLFKFYGSDPDSDGYLENTGA